MTFDKLHNGANCNCLEEGCFEDIANLFGLKTNKPELREVDFKSQFQKAIEKDDPLDLHDCKDICSYKGISNSILTEENKEAVISIYKALFPSAPKYRPHMTIIKWKQNAGLIKCTPLDFNPHHYDFYPCDTFSHVDHVEVIESISLAEHV